MGSDGGGIPQTTQATSLSRGAAVYTGTVEWTTDGMVTRTLELTDSRVGTCSSKPARLAAEVTSTYKESPDDIGTFYTVD